MKKRSTDIVWDFGFSDEMTILVMNKNKNGRFVIVDKIKGNAKPLAYYLEKILKYKDCLNHLPDDAFYKMHNGESVADVLTKNDFKVVN